MTKKESTEKKVKKDVSVKCAMCETLKAEIEHLKLGTKKDKTEKELEQLEKRKLRNLQKREEFEVEQMEREKKYDTIQKLNIELQQKILSK